jgi:hypothetical protein
MASGPEHYQEAERLLAVCAGDQRGSALDQVCTAAAHVHAVLAKAAATACYSHDDKAAWQAVAGGKPEPVTEDRGDQDDGRVTVEREDLRLIFDAWGTNVIRSGVADAYDRLLVAAGLGDRIQEQEGGR